jgi:hypothetical protein
MIVKQYLQPIHKKAFRPLIKELLMEGLEPTLCQEGTEINLYYNHPAGLPKRMVSRLGWFRTVKECSDYLEFLYAIEETVRKEWGL